MRYQNWLGEIDKTFRKEIRRLGAAVDQAAAKGAKMTSQGEP